MFSSSYKKAAEVYELGIKRGAQPLTRLQRRKDRFDERVQGLGNNHQHQTVDRLQTLERSRQRTVLGVKSDSSVNASMPANVFNQIHPGISSSFLGNRPSITTTSSSDSSRPCEPQFAVFPDRNSSSQIAATLSNPTTIDTTMTNIPIVNAHQLKENRPFVQKFAGTTIPQRSYPRPSGPTFQVYHDDVSFFFFL